MLPHYAMLSLSYVNFSNTSGGLSLAFVVFVDMIIPVLRQHYHNYYSCVLCWYLLGRSVYLSFLLKNRFASSGHFVLSYTFYYHHIKFFKQWFEIWIGFLWIYGVILARLTCSKYWVFSICEEFISSFNEVFYTLMF